MNQPLTVIARIRAKAGQESRAREALLGLVAPTRRETGCLDYVLHQSLMDPAAFVFYENWASEELLDAHAKSPHIQAFRQLAAEILDSAVEITKWKKID